MGFLADFFVFDSVAAGAGGGSCFIVVLLDLEV